MECEHGERRSRRRGVAASRRLRACSCLAGCSLSPLPPPRFVPLPSLHATCPRCLLRDVAMTRPLGWLSDGPADWNSEGRREKGKREREKETGQKDRKSSSQPNGHDTTKQSNATRRLTAHTSTMRRQRQHRTLRTTTAASQGPTSKHAARLLHEIKSQVFANGRRADEMSEGIWLNRTQETAKNPPDALHLQARRLRGSGGVVERELGGKKKGRIATKSSQQPEPRCRRLTAHRCQAAAAAAARGVVVAEVCRPANALS